MPEQRTVEEENALREAQQIAKYRELHAACVQLFGPPGERTPLGKLILDTLETRFLFRKLPEAYDNLGRTDELRTFRIIGRWDVIQAIHDAIEWKEPTHANRS
jgi:hypothetical protein